MPSRKIRVGVADESLTPDEEHKLEVKLDKMLAVPGAPVTDSSAEETKLPEAPPEKPVPETPTEPAKKTKVTVTSDDSDDGSVLVTSKPITPKVKEAAVPEPDPEPEVPAAAAVPAPQLVRLPWRPPVTDVSADDVAAEVAPETPLGDVTLDSLDDLPETPVSDAKSDETSDKKATTEPTSEQDAEIAKAFGADSPKTSFVTKLKGWAKAWWGNKKLRFGTIGAFVFLLLVLAILPSSRAMALNLFGVRGSLSVQVLDGTTQLPLSDATVTIGGAHGTSNSKGTASLHGVKLGSQLVSVQKVAFITGKKSVHISTGTNNAGTIGLQPDGTQYKFSLTDFVTGKPIVNGRATSGQSSAVADSKGLITLTVKATTANLDVTISAQNYRSSKIKVAVGKSATTPVAMVTTDKEIYISKQSGKYDVYKADIDGQNRQVLLAGTGNETSSLSLLPNPSDDIVALVSTRDNVKNSDGYLLRTLTLINVVSGAATTIDHSENIQVIGWSGDRLVYVEAKAGASAANPSRYQMYSYDAKSAQRLLLDHANYFNDVVAANGAIYYATSNQYSGGVSQFNKINADNTGKQTILVDEVWNIYRTAHDTFALDTSAGWYNYTLGGAKPTTGTAYKGDGHLYLDSADGKHSLWVDQRDGKGALLVYDTTTKKDTVLTEQSGLTYPVRWLNANTIIYRVKTSSETADYIVGLNGGTPKKLADVTNVPGVTFFQGQ